MIGNVGVEKHRDDELGTDPYLSRITPFAGSGGHAAWNPEEASILTWLRIVIWFVVPMGF